MTERIRDKVIKTFEDSISVKKQIIEDNSYKVLLEAGDIIADSISGGGKLLLCGNGGSAADAQHLAAEFLVRLTSDVNRESIPALSLAQDTSSDISNHKRNFQWSAGFLAFFIVTESMMSWDWIMSVDPHWFSTLFGWYVFASMFVSGITTIALITIYLKSKGYLEKVNHNHIHDLGKFMFGVSVFWTYLWFSQFMLIWYANIPEEVTYFITRIEDYNLPFFGMIALNFIFPLLLLMNSDYKRVNWFIVMTGIIILIGHYIDVFNMIMPATVGDKWFIGIPELSSVAFFAGLFIYVVFNSISKAPLEPSGDPLLKESEKFVY